IPIGLILRYNSATPIQAWMPADASEVIRKRLEIPSDWNDNKENRNPAVQFDNKIAPIIPFAFRGVIWYQGERNAKAQTGWEYRHLLPFLIQTWRERWAARTETGVRRFPFYYVQVPTQESPPDAEWPWLRDAMRRALKTTENTGMATFYDHGPGLHPENKQPAGKRLSLWALANDYGRMDIVCSGPLLDTVNYENGKAILNFQYIGGGLKNAGDGPALKFFEVAGKDGQYAAADARIVNDSVIVSSSSIPEPAYVRYLFRKSEPDPTVSLINAAGLPASPFISDDFRPPRDESAATDQPESDGLAPEIAGLTAADVSYALEKNIPDLNTPYISTAPEDLSDGIPVGVVGKAGGNPPPLVEFAQEIAAGRHGEIDSLLLFQNGRLLFESYYRRGRINYPHYQMSITKSYTALAIGRAVQLSHLTMDDLDRPVVDFLTNLDRTRLVPGATSITLAAAMNMRSGIRVSREKINALRRTSDALQGQGQIQAYLENSAPITRNTQTFKYQGSDPSLAMQVLEAVVPGSAGNFIKTEVLGKLGITSYGWQPDVSGLPKSAAGSSMRSRDMLKWGMLVAGDGRWMDEQLIPSAFIRQAISRIHTNPQKTSYGYFWWRHDMQAGDRSFDCHSGRGAGGQFILILPELKLIAVITAHQKGMGSLLKTFPKRVLPAFIKQQKFHSRQQNSRNRG
ncbi:MAG: serine hydrolase, partial [Planctomycetaceae bacterium]